MPQVVSGQTGYFGGETGGTGNGVGAVIFDAPSVNRANAGNLLFQALQNRANQMNQEQIEKEKAIQAKSFAMLDGIDIEKKGVFEPDLPYFQEKTKELIDRRGQIYAKYGGDLTSKQALQDINALDGEKAKLKLEAQLSANDKETYSDATKKLTNNPSRYIADKSTVGLEAYKTTKLGERAGVQTLHERPPSLLVMMDKHSKTIGDDEETSSPYTDASGKVLYKTTKGKSPEKVNQSYQMLYQTDAEARAIADETYDQLPAEEKSAIETIRAISGMTDVPPAQIWLGNAGSKMYSTKSEKLKGMGNNMYSQDALIRGRMAYRQRLKDEANESSIYKTFVSYGQGESPDIAVNLKVPTVNGIEEATYNPADAKAGVFSTGDGITAPNTFYGTIVKNMTINGKNIKVVKKVDTKALLSAGIIKKDAVESGEVLGLIDAKDVQTKLMQNFTKLPDYTSSDAVFLAKANGATDKAITSTNKVYGAESKGGMLDIKKVNPRQEPITKEVGQLQPKTTHSAKVAEKPKAEAPKAQIKEKVVNGVKMPYNATPKYSKQTGKLIGYELPDGTKFKL